jgi:hypothetical protein
MANSADLTEKIYYPLTMTTSSSTTYPTSNSLGWTGNTIYVDRSTFDSSYPQVVVQNPEVRVVALDVDLRDDPIKWLKDRVREVQDCWKEAA